MENFIENLFNSISDIFESVNATVSKNNSRIKREKKLKCDSCGASLSGNTCEYCGKTYTEANMYVDSNKDHIKGSDSNN